MTTTDADKKKVIANLIVFANKLGYGVDLEADLEGPAGVVSHQAKLILLRKNKSLDGQITTLVHEIGHILLFVLLTQTNYLELYSEYVVESLAQDVTQEVGVDRTKKTTKFINGLGYKKFVDFDNDPVLAQFRDVLEKAAKGEEISVTSS